MSVERKKSLARAQRIEKRLAIVKELKENKKVWAIAGAATSTAGFLLILRYYLKEKAGKETKSSLNKIAREVVESSESVSQTLKEGAILVIAPKAAQDLEDLKTTKGGKRFLRWLKKICGFSGAPSGTSTIEDQIIYASTIAAERIVKPEIEQDKQTEPPS